MAKVSIKVIENEQSQPFLRGVLTHSLVKRGMAFESAYEIARKVRIKLEQKVAGKQLQISRMDLMRLVDTEIDALLGEEYRKKFREARNRSREIKVRTPNSSYPFSKGILARSLTGAGVDPEDSYEMARQIEKHFLRQSATEISEQELLDYLREKIVATFGKHTATFYDLARKINHLNKPVIIYLSGAGGTGKSTLATELAARLGIMKTTGTDMVRQIMRIMFSEEILPSLYGSSFEPTKNSELNHLDADDRVLNNFIMQATKVCVGVKAVAERAIEEKMNIILEGVHLLPGLLQFEGLMNKAYHIPIVLGLMDRKDHRSRLEHRTASRNPARYVEAFKSIRTIHDYFMEQAQMYDVDLINNVNYDVTIREIIQCILERLGEQVEAENRAAAKKS